ncbi:MAG TPA: allantoinase [Blastocatellia bacterium]|nr:allantoinase [Blastocatellia bacterium]
MEKRQLVYGLRLFDPDEVSDVMPAQVIRKDGTMSSVTMHILEGTKDEIRQQLLRSLDAFFELHD